MLSLRPEGASGNSPGREPWVDVNDNQKPRRGDTTICVCRPFGAPTHSPSPPSPHGLGYCPTPLRGGNQDFDRATGRSLLLFRLQIKADYSSVRIRAYSSNATSNGALNPFSAHTPTLTVSSHSSEYEPSAIH